MNYKEHSYGEIPKVEVMLTSYLSPESGSSLKAPVLPTKQVRTTSALVGKALSLSQHFQSVLQTLEEQVAGERQRLVETHLARVVATLNNNRRLALESYLSAVQSDPPQVRH